MGSKGDEDLLEASSGVHYSGFHLEESHTSEIDQPTSTDGSVKQPFVIGMWRRDFVSHLRGVSSAFTGSICHGFVSPNLLSDARSKYNLLLWSTTPKLGYDISYFRPAIDDALRDHGPQEEWITRACGIHNKLDFEFPGCFPRILGHEDFGIVESVGEGIEELKEGDSVVPIFLPECMDCVDCKSKKTNLCSKFPFQITPLMHRDDSSRFTTVEGETLQHFLYVSSFSDYTVFDVVNVRKIDPEIPPNKARLFSCGVSTGVGAAWKTADVEPGSIVVIFGLGSIGLAGSSLELLNLSIPKAVGINLLSQVIIEMTNGGADYCFECVGLAKLVQEPFAYCRKEFQLDKFVTHEVNFEDINNAFELLIQGKSLHCVI
ncbi:putative lysine histidine transporter-like 8-like [Capsicum annuum]|nr:putative lysine histidine transporter-like 8-like [Capsicum annuum]KAF3620430.1 putative lysine histidine transporter-like 8-like [Capsicum annuum]